MDQPPGQKSDSCREMTIVESGGSTVITFNLQIASTALFNGICIQVFQCWSYA